MKTHTRASITLSALSGLLLLSGGCGGAQSTEATTPAVREETRLPPTPPERPWAELSTDERRAHMARHVVPVMSELFAGYDAERFADVSCETCHGSGASERGFAMPSPDLLPLYPTGSIGQYQMVSQYPLGVRFMFSEVVPAMRTMLGASEYDAATGEGFSCFACHPHAAEDDPLSAPSPG